MILLLGFVVVLACGWPTGHYQAPQKKPVSEDIVGIWVLPAVEVQEMQRRGGYSISSHTLEFDENGTFMMTNMPDWWLSEYGESGGELVSGTGTWAIVDDFGKWVVEVHLTTLNEHLTDTTQQLRLGRSQSPYTLFYWIGDPDSGVTMVYEKQQAD